MRRAIRPTIDTHKGYSLMFKYALTAVAAIASASAANATVQLVTPGLEGTYTNLPSTFSGSGVYGAELRRGNNATNGDWEIGVGEATSQSGSFTQNQFAWGSGTYNFSATWGASGLSVTVNGQTTSYANAPLLGDTLRIGAKRDATVTILNVDGTAFNQVLSGTLGTGVGNYLYFASSDAFGGNGVTFSGTVRIGGAGGSGSASEIFFENGNFAAVPEPATWAMMIGGFGVVGAAMRRRRSVQVSFA